MSVRLRFVLLAVVALLATLPGISRLPPIDRDESRYVQATRQMAETGDYIDIRLQETSRYNKPIGIYWMQSVAVALSGDGAAAPIWVYRLVSSLGIVIAVLGVAWTGMRLFGPDAGTVAGLVMAGIVAVAFEGRIAKTDAMLLGLSVVAQGALAQIWIASRREGEQAKSLPWLFWGAQGLGILVKGPITPLVSGITVAGLYALKRDWRWLARLRPWMGLGLVALIVLPWLALITWKSGGAFWQQSVGRDLLGKVAEGQESHGAPPGYYTLTFALYMWPFALPAVDAGLRAINRARDDARLLYCLVWYLPFWLVFELVPTKLPHYMLPAYPALALLVGWSLTREGGPIPLAGWQKVVWAAAAFGQVVVTLGLAAFAVGAPLHLEGRFSAEGAAVAAFVLVAGWFAWPSRTAQPIRRVVMAALAAVAAYALMFSVVAPSLTTLWLSPRIAEAVRQHRPCDATVLASAGYHEPSLVFLTATDTLLTNPEGAGQHLLADPACALALVPTGQEAQLAAFLAIAGRVPEPLTKIDGINYSSGDAVSLTLYRLKP